MNGLEIIDRSNREQTAGYAVKEAAAMYGMLVLVLPHIFLSLRSITRSRHFFFCLYRQQESQSGRGDGGEGNGSRF